MREYRLVCYDDVQIEVVTEGDGDLVVLLPSLGRDSDDYDRLAAEFAARGYRVLRPKPRGVGRSRGASRNVTLHDYARDIAKVIESEGRGPAIVVGHAFGNWVARTLATDQPLLVRGIVVAAAGAKQMPPYLAACIDKCEDASLEDEARIRYLRMTFFAPASDPRPWLEGWYPELKAAQRAARAATPLDEFWRAGTAPVLDLIAGRGPAAGGLNVIARPREGGGVIARPRPGGRGDRVAHGEIMLNMGSPRQHFASTNAGRIQ